jgi:predicted deacylase
MSDDVFAAYLREEARERRLEALTSSVGGRLIELGTSVWGRPLRAAVVDADVGAGADAPVVFVNANLHGVEWIGGLCALGVLEALGTSRGQALRQQATVVVAPCLNPDGFHKTERSNGADALRVLRTNANSVDLNRNFARPDRDETTTWAPSRLPLAMSGSTDPNRATFRGERPFSEPETQAVSSLLAAMKPRAVLSFHSFMGTLIPPKVTTWHDARAYRRLCWAYRRGQTRHFAPTVMFAPVDVFTGELEDHAHHVHGSWALTVEVFPLWQSLTTKGSRPTLFSRFNPADPAPIVDDAVGGAIAYLLAALQTNKPTARRHEDNHGQ